MRNSQLTRGEGLFVAEFQFIVFRSDSATNEKSILQPFCFVQCRKPNRTVMPRRWFGIRQAEALFKDRIGLA
jgi:hypothetical protein